MRLNHLLVILVPKYYGLTLHAVVIGELCKHPGEPSSV